MTTKKDLLEQLIAIRIGQERLLEVLLGQKVDLLALAQAPRERKVAQTGHRSRVLYATDRPEWKETLSEEDQAALERARRATEAIFE